MVASCCVVINARRLGRSAINSAECIRVSSRSRWKFWKVLTELRRSAKISRLTCFCTLCRTSRRLVQVRPAEISNIESRNLVRIRSFSIGALSCRLWSLSKSRYKFVAHAVDRSEVYRIGRIFLQLLSQLQNVIVHGARGGIILIAPDFIQQFVAGNYSLRIPHHELQGLELLGREPDGLAVARHFHLGKIHGDAIETVDIAGRGPRAAPQRCPHPRQ